MGDAILVFVLMGAMAIIAVFGIFTPQQGWRFLSKLRRGEVSSKAAYWHCIALAPVFLMLGWSALLLFVLNWGHVLPNTPEWMVVTVIIAICVLLILAGLLYWFMAFKGYIMATPKGKFNAVFSIVGGLVLMIFLLSIPIVIVGIMGSDYAQQG